MAGKKGMRHRRPKTAVERDEYALAAIESYIDHQYLKCDSCLKDMNINEMKATTATLMLARYHKLRPTLSANEVKMTVQTMSDVLREVSERKQRLERDITPDAITHVIEQVQPVDS